jgi:hypothetical protein
MANKPCPPTTPRLISRPRAVLLAPPPCFQEAECHGQSTTSSPHDQSGQRRIHEELADAHLALRPALHMPSHPPPPPSPSRVRLGRPQPGASPCSLALKVTDSAGGGSTRVPRILYASPGSVLCMCMNPEATGSPPPLPESRSWGRPQPGASPCSLVLNVTDSAGGGVPAFPEFSMHHQALACVCA